MDQKKESRRKLTAAERAREERFEKAKAELEAQGYTAHDLTVGLVCANIMALVLGLPIVALLGIGFFLRNPAGTRIFGIGGTLLFFAVFFCLIVVHELIHGIFWALCAKNRWKSISFGFMAAYLTPYCCCAEGLKKGQYILGALMPTVLLGILPALAAIVTGSASVFGMGALMILSGGGDLTIVLKLLRFPGDGRDTLYMDHPYLAGLVVFTR